MAAAHTRIPGHLILPARSSASTASASGATIRKTVRLTVAEGPLRVSRPGIRGPSFPTTTPAMVPSVPASLPGDPAQPNAFTTSVRAGPLHIQNQWPPTALDASSH